MAYRAVKTTDYLPLILVGLVIWVLLRGGAPSPGPAPIPLQKLCVLIVEETGDRGKADTPLNVILSTRMRGYIIEKHGEFRLMDKDLSGESLSWTPEPWKSAFDRAKKDSTGRYPWWLVSDGKKGVSEPLPKTEDEALATLRKYGE